MTQELVWHVPTYLFVDVFICHILQGLNVFADMPYVEICSKLEQLHRALYRNRSDKWKHMLLGNDTHQELSGSRVKQYLEGRCAKVKLNFIIDDSLVLKRTRSGKSEV